MILVPYQWFSTKGLDAVLLLLQLSFENHVGDWTEQHLFSTGWPSPPSSKMRGRSPRMTSGFLFRDHHHGRCDTMDRPPSNLTVRSVRYFDSVRSVKTATHIQTYRQTYTEMDRPFYRLYHMTRMTSILAINITRRPQPFSISCHSGGL